MRRGLVGMQQGKTAEGKRGWGWKECPDYVDEGMKYSVDEDNPRIATANSNEDCLCTVIGDTPLPRNKVTSWSIKILKTRCGNGNDTYVGVAPSDIDQNEGNNSFICGWYFYCELSTVCAGPPHNHRWPGKDYGPRKEIRQYVFDGDSVGVVMDMAKDDLSFVLNGVNLGVAFEGIPLDKPLVPCALLYLKGDAVELDISEVKEDEVDSSIPVPSGILLDSDRWHSINLTWNRVRGASFYQIETDGSKSWDVSTTNTFRKRGLLPYIEHTFRVRAVRGSYVSEWSGVAKGETIEAPTDFSDCVWEECPDYVYKDRKYSVGWNPRIATKTNDNDYRCTIIGNTALPLRKVNSWSIKILKSKENDGGNIYIGVSPSEINQNMHSNFDRCGWYFDCYGSTLWSGLPHNYRGKEYGPRKKWGEYVRTGDRVGVVMNTRNGELSFVLDEVNHGVAYEDIPLDKPLVACVLLLWQGDSVELRN